MDNLILHFYCCYPSSNYSGLAHFVHCNFARSVTGQIQIPYSNFHDSFVLLILIPIFILYFLFHIATPDGRRPGALQKSKILQFVLHVTVAGLRRCYAHRRGAMWLKRSAKSAERSPRSPRIGTTSADRAC